ncbi:MAG: phosphatase PAP2 family protein [Pyrinomonadaceae bacterium]|nr:phosphatase PAP2 family protein [Acidobacteriota bacterium]MBK7932969.1 phosphatase PAP2 family protein [Acidobacteriota bacterium]MBP7376794.1 phosphatase PAP2 family protein [Pyrinomonadaceae bacterium]
MGEPPDKLTHIWFDWGMIRRSLVRPYRVPVSMVFFLALVPFYVLIPEFLPPEVRYSPALELDRALPLLPSWALVYGALYLFLILLPIFVVRHDELVRRMFNAYLLTWITAYLFFFVLYPTVAPRPEIITGEGFGTWGLRALYSADPPYNCFPSLHVAHSFVSALACSRVHRGLGVVATIFATLVAVSTLLTKQHFMLDLIAGIFLATVAYAIFLRSYPYDRISKFDRRIAPAIAMCVGALVAAVLAISWLAYIWGGETQFTFGP